VGIGLQARFIYRALRARFRDQTAELKAIRAHVRPGDTVCDVGANKGSYLFWLSRWCPGGLVVAFEPQPLLLDYLTTVRDSLKLGNVRIEPRAAFSSSGTMDLFVPFDRAPGASLNRRILEGDDCKTIAVKTVALDDYFAPGQKIALLKIDVEGAELDVLKGAERILRESAPLLVFECENRHLEKGTVNDVFSYIFALGYSGSFICGRRLLPIAQFDAAKHQRQDDTEFWKSPGYCNNFVFSAAVTPV